MIQYYIYCIFIFFMLPSYFFIYCHVIIITEITCKFNQSPLLHMFIQFNIVWLATSRSITSPVVPCTLCPFEFIITLTTVHVFVHYEHVIFNHLNIDYALLHVIKSIYFFLLVFTTQDCIEFHYFIN